MKVCRLPSSFALGLFLLLVSANDAFSAKTHVFTYLNGNKQSMRVERATIHITGAIGTRQNQKIVYEYISTDDLIWVAEEFEQSHNSIQPILEERVQDKIDEHQFEEADRVMKALPFMKAPIEAALIDKLKDANLETINEIANNFPGMRPSICAVIAKRLESATDEFFAIGKFKDQGNHNEYMEKKIAAYKEIAAKYKEIRSNAVTAINAELSDRTNYRYWEDLKILSDLMASFPETGPTVKTVLIRSVHNPATLEKKQHVVYYDNFGVRFSRDDVTEHLGGWYTKRGMHPVRPREELSIEVFDRGRMEAIYTRWPVFKAHLEGVIAQELKNTARRWSWNELRELVVSFPDISKEAQAVVARDLNSPKPQFADVDLAEIVEAFPDLEDTVEERIERDLANPQKVYSPEALIHIVQKYPDIESSAETRLREQMKNPVFNRDFESLDRIDEIVSAFPNLKGCGTIALGRMIANPMRSGSTGDGKPDRELAQQIATRFPNGLTGDVEEVYETALKNTALRWDREELLELKVSFPGLEPTIAEAIARDFNTRRTDHSIDDLLKTAQQFPSIKDHCADLVLEHVQNPASTIELKKLMEIAWRFPSLADELEPYIDRAVDRMVDSRYRNDYHAYYSRYNGRMIEYFCALMRDYPDQEEVIREVVYRRIERIVQHSDKTSLVEWVNNFDPPYDERVAEALATKEIEIEKPESMPEPAVPELRGENLTASMDAELHSSQAPASESGDDKIWQERVEEKAKEMGQQLLRDYWHYLVAAGVAFLIMCYLCLLSKRKVFWQWVFSILFVFPLLLYIRRTLKERARTRREGEASEVPGLAESE